MSLFQTTSQPMKAFDSNSSVSPLATSSVALIAGLFLLAACDSSGNTREQPTLEVSTQAAGSGQTVVASGDTVVFEPLRPDEDPCKRPGDCSLPSIGITSTQGEILITDGYFLSPHGTSTLEGAIEKNENQVTVRISLPEDEDVTDMSTPFLYQARVTDLEPGTYQLRILHERDLLRVVRGSTDQDARAVVADRSLVVK